MQNPAPLTQWQRIKSVYPFLYAISYRVCMWPSEYRKDKAGFFAVALVNMWLAFAIFIPLGDWLGVNFPDWSVLPLAAVLLGAQYLLFDRPKLGPKFEKRLDKLSSGERWGIGLYAACWVVMVGTLFFVTITHHRHLIGVD